MKIKSNPIENVDLTGNFEKRVTELTDEETEAMMNPGAKAIDARHAYMIKCAWADYLNGTSDFKPFDSKREAARVWEILSNDNQM